MLLAGDPQLCAVHHYGLSPDPKTTALVLVHGWLGSSADWIPLLEPLGKLFCIFAIDLPGHGSSQGDLPNSYEDSVTLIRETVAALKNKGPLWVYGYSLGGRLVLGMYRQLEHIQRVFLESAHLGLCNQDQKTARLLVDVQRAQRLQSLGLEQFLNEFYALDIFASLQRSPERRTERIERRLSKPAWGGAAMLLANSLAQQPPSSPLDPEKVTLLSGSMDTEYTAHYEAASISNGVKHYVVPAAGHAVHEENPAAIVTLLRLYLEQSPKIKGAVSTALAAPKDP